MKNNDGLIFWILYFIITIMLFTFMSNKQPKENIQETIELEIRAEEAIQNR